MARRPRPGENEAMFNQILADAHARLNQSRPTGEHPAQFDIDKYIEQHNRERDGSVQSPPPTEAHRPEQFSDSTGSVERIAIASLQLANATLHYGSRSQQTGSYPHDPRYGRSGALPPESQRRPEAPRRPVGRGVRFVGAVAAVVASYGATNVPVSYTAEGGWCRTDIARLGCVPAGMAGAFADAVPILGEVTSVRDMTSVFIGQRSDESGNVTVHGSENQSGNTPEVDLKEFSFNKLFESGIPVGSVTASTTNGKALINYGKKSVEMPMTSSRIVDFTARPTLESKTVEKNGKKTDVFSVSQPFVVEKDDKGIKLTFDPSKVTVVTSLGGEGAYNVSGSSTSGFNVERKSESGDFSVSFLDKAPLKSSDASAASVNPYAKPSKENAAILGQLYDLKNWSSVVTKSLTDACVNRADKTPLQVSKAIPDSINAQIEAKIDAMARENKIRIELHILKTNYNLNPNAVIAHTIQYAKASGNTAVEKIAGEIMAAHADGAKKFVSTADTYECIPSEGFIK